jgi:hypothetical protein
MNFSTSQTVRLYLLLGLLLALAVVVSIFPPVSQSSLYHNFADTRAMLGIPNCLNVISNVAFLFVGILGLRFLLRAAPYGASRFIDRRERWLYVVFFVGVALVFFNSSYYHLQPSNERLVLDRSPMTLAFMALVAATVAERISVRAGLLWCVPLLVLGDASVLYWRVTELHGHGDLRFYGFVQFGSLLTILLLLLLFPPRYTRGADLVVALGFYALAKVFESCDQQIFALGHIVSGHTLKHLAAAFSAYWILRMLKLRAPVRGTA